jgi:hypothetical protein
LVRKHERALEFCAQVLARFRPFSFCETTEATTPFQHHLTAAHGFRIIVATLRRKSDFIMASIFPLSALKGKLFFDWHERTEFQHAQVQY